MNDPPIYAESPYETRDKGEGHTRVCFAAGCGPNARLSGIRVATPELPASATLTQEQYHSAHTAGYTKANALTNIPGAFKAASLGT